MLNNEVPEVSVEEQVNIATKKLEDKCSDLTYKIYLQEDEINRLKSEIEKQKIVYEKAIANLVLELCGNK